MDSTDFGDINKMNMEAASEKKYHILYVDDEEHNLTSFRAAFRRYFFVHTANSAKEGMKVLEENFIHLIVTDQRMPEMTGVQFLEKLQPSYPDAIRMILTGFSDVEDIIKAINTGNVYRYITKPWDEKELKMTIDLALDSYELKTHNSRLLDEVRQREAKFRSIINNATDLISILDAEGTYKFISPSVKNILGYETEDLLDKNGFDLIHPEDVDFVREVWNKGLTEPDFRLQAEFRYLHKGGDWVFLETKGSFLKEEIQDGQVILNSRDITERKRNEELLRDKEVAEESNRLKQQFLANMSHEIRTPMNAILGMTKLIMPTELSQLQRKYMDAIQQSAGNLLVIINDILDVAKIEAGKIEFESIDFSLASVFEGALNTLRFKAEEKGLALHQELSSDLPAYLCGDPVRLNQILLNLAGNAIKFTEKGSVTICCKKVGEAQDGPLLEFAVRDTGIGIPADKLGAVFESFSQASSDTTRKYGGTGLGLTISKQLVELQGGSISVSSEFGVGTTFSFTIPVKVGVEPNRGETKSTASVAEELSEISILLVEDNQFNQMVAIDTLESVIRDVKIDVAENGKLAIEKLSTQSIPTGKQYPYDIILMDVQMPVMNGYDTTIHIRKELGPELSGIPIMAMTANATKDEVERCFSCGMDEYISKPFEVEDLLNKISKFVVKSALA